MKVLLLNGSTRKNSCTYFALSEVAKALETDGVETEIVQMGGGAVRDCIGCNGCAGKGQCVFGDDMVNEMIAKAKEVIAEKLTGNIVKEIYVPGRIVNIVMK